MVRRCEKDWMFAGHFAVAFLGKRIEPTLSLGTLALASMLPDLLFDFYQIAGLESVQLGTGRGAANYLHVVNVTYSHSLLGCAVAGALLAGIYFWKRRSARAACMLFAATLSHWLLDFISHRQDMALAPGFGPRFGLGLWTSIPTTLVVEGGLWAIALVLYARAFRAKNRAGVFVLWIGVALLTLLWYNTIAGAPPASMRTMQVGGLIVFSVLIGWAYWVDRLRSA